jgi:lactate dehydrogenase-like 2-hydroxyacid dehydrogenase
VSLREPQTRTPAPRGSLSREIIERLPQLKLIASTTRRNASIDMAAAEERGIRDTGTGYRSTPTIEMTWAFITRSSASSETLKKFFSAVS